MAAGREAPTASPLVGPSWLERMPHPNIFSDIVPGNFNPYAPPPRLFIPRPFRFLDLPAEIRLQIYHYLLPHKYIFEFSHSIGTNYPTHRGGHGFFPYLINCGNDWSAMVALKEKGKYQVVWNSNWHLQASLFLVSKFVSDEARAVLYCGNTFEFTIDDRSHKPTSLRSPRIFGAFGTENRLHLLRNLRSVVIYVNVGTINSWALRRLRARLDYFVGVLKEHSDDENQESLLTRLKVRFRILNAPGLERREPRNLSDDRAKTLKVMYCLEALTSLRGIDKVKIVGDTLPEWYARALELCIMGGGGDIQPMQYPGVRVKRWVTKPRRGYRRVMQTTKLWHQPALNWEEFAERNEIHIPSATDTIKVEEAP